jgi:hypothetical protein
LVELGHQVVDVQNDTRTRQLRKPSSKDEKIGQVMELNGLIGSPRMQLRQFDHSQQKETQILQELSRNPIIIPIAYRQPDDPYVVTELDGGLGLTAQTQNVYLVAISDQRLSLSLDTGFATRIVSMHDHAMAFAIH